MIQPLVTLPEGVYLHEKAAVSLYTTEKGTEIMGEVRGKLCQHSWGIGLGHLPLSISIPFISLLHSCIAAALTQGKLNRIGPTIY